MQKNEEQLGGDTERKEKVVEVRVQDEVEIDELGP